MQHMASARRSRVLLVSGGVLILAGLVVLSYVGWQFFGTTWVSERRHAEAVKQLEKGWDTGEATVKTGHGTADSIIRIPRFGDDYAVPVLEGTSDDALASGFGHFDGTAKPGAVGNFALAGHRVTHGEPLRDMPDLEVGDTVIVETAKKTFTYEMVTDGDALTVDFTASWVLDPVPTNPEKGGVQPPQDPDQRLLTLTTCSELFHTDNRLIAFAVLVDQRVRA